MFLRFLRPLGVVLSSFTLVVGLFGSPSLCRRLPAGSQAPGRTANPPGPLPLEVCVAGEEGAKEPGADPGSASTDPCPYCQLGQGLGDWHEAVLQAPKPVPQPRPTPLSAPKPFARPLVSQPSRAPPALSLV